MSEDLTLHEQVAVEPARQPVIDECVRLIDSQVKSKSGFGGVAIRAAYATIKTLKRRFVPGVVDALLDDWVGKLEPYYVSWKKSGTGSYAEYLTARSGDVAEDLLEVTDKRAETTKHKRAKKYYFKHRERAKQDVTTAVPELARIIDSHLQAAPGEKPAEPAEPSDAAAG